MPIYQGTGGLTPTEARELELSYSVTSAQTENIFGSPAPYWLPYWPAFVGSNRTSTLVIAGEIMLVNMIFPEGRPIHFIGYLGTYSTLGIDNMQVQFFEHNQNSLNPINGQGLSNLSFQAQDPGTLPFTLLELSEPFEPTFLNGYMAIGIPSQAGDNDWTLGYYPLTLDDNELNLTNVYPPALWDASSRWTSGDMPSDFAEETDTLSTIKGSYLIRTETRIGI